MKYVFDLFLTTMKQTHTHEIKRKKDKMTTNVATIIEPKKKSAWKSNFYMLVRTENFTYNIDVSKGFAVYPKMVDSDNLEDANECATDYLKRNFKKVTLVTNKEYRKRGTK